MFLFDYPAAVIAAMFFSGWWATIFSTVFSVAVILTVAAEEFVGAYLALVIYVILLAIFTPVNPFMFIWDQPLQALGFFILYFVIGAIYSTMKYWSYVTKMVNKIKETKIAFIQAFGLPISPLEEVPEEFGKQWKDFKYDHIEYGDRERIARGFRPGVMADKICNWIAFWPFSAVGLFIADPLRKLVTSIYEHLVSIYGKMYDKIVTSNINMNDLK